MRKLFKNRRGITLAEVSIAMAVVTIVTVSALSIIVSSTTTTTRAIYKTEAQYFASDALECFRAADDSIEFEKAMEFRGGTEICKEDNCHTEYNYHYKLLITDYEAYIATDYGDGQIRPTFSIVINDDDGETVTKLKFTKGVKLNESPNS